MNDIKESVLSTVATVDAPLDKITIIGIAGGTGSGKTTVVKKIVESLPPHFVAVVPLDSYYNDTTGMTLEASYQAGERIAQRACHRATHL